MTDVQVTMPQLGETVAEGTVVQWLVEVGQRVRPQEPLLEVSTDKVDTEIVSPADGVLSSIVVGQAETVAVGSVLATISTGPSAVSPSAPEAASSLQMEHDLGHLATHKPRQRDSPRVRRLARNAGVDLTHVQRSGRHGRATATDVSAAAAVAVTSKLTRENPPFNRPPIDTALPAGSRTGTLSRRRRIIADRMLESLRVSAQLTTVIEVDLTRVSVAREKAKAEFRRRHQVPLTVLAFVAEAAVHGLGSNPVVNARLDSEAGTVSYSTAVHLGVAVDTEQGLAVPVIRHAEDLTVPGLARRIAGVAARTREGTITADEVTGGTFTVTNTGSRGALFDTPIINQPQVAILGFGAVVRRPMVVADASGGEQLAVRSMAYLALTYDHRLIDGADAARYLATVKLRLERRGIEAIESALAGT